MITLTLTFNTEAEAVAFLSREPRLGSSERPLTDADAKADTEGKARPSRAPKAETPAPAPAAVSSQQETADASSASSTGASESQEDALDYEKDIKPLIVKLGAVKGRDAVMEVFKALGVDKGPSLKPAQYADAKAALVAAGA